MEKVIRCFQMPSGQVLLGEVDGDDILFPCWFFQEVNQQGQLMHRLVMASFSEDDKVTLNKDKPIFTYNPIKEVKDLYNSFIENMRKQRAGIIMPNFKK